MNSSAEFENSDDLNTAIQNNHNNNGNNNEIETPPTAPIHQTITITPNDDDVKREEEGELAGLYESRNSNIDPENDDDILIPEGQRLQENEVGEVRPTSQNPLIRSGTMLLMVGGAGAFIALIWFGLFSPRPVTKKTVTETTTTEATPIPDNSAELKANLAFQDQRRAVATETSTPTPTTTTSDRRPETRTARTTTTRTAAPPQTRVVTRTVQAPPRVITRTVESPPRVVTRTITRTVRVPANNPQPATQPRITTPTNTPQTRPQVEQVDPAEQWTRLSQLGEVKTGNNNKTTQTTEANASTTNNTAEAPTSQQSTNISPPETQQNIRTGSNRTTSSSTTIPTVTIGEDSKSYTEETVEEVNNRQSSNINIPTENTENRTTVETVTYTATDSSTNEVINNTETDQYQTQTLVDRSLVASADFLVYSDGGSSNDALTIALTDGEEGILNRKPRNQTGTSIKTTREIAIGKSAKGRVIVPLNWNEAGQDPTRSRTTIELTESLMATDGMIGLPKGTMIIAQPDNIGASNKFVSISAIAIVYRDSQGRVRQQQIPVGAITVNSKNNEPLIARGYFDPGGSIAKQDLLVGALSGLGKVGEIINRPRSETISDDDGIDSRRRTRTTTSDPNIVGAALEGFFGVTGRRLEQRSNQATEELLKRPNINVVPAGTEVTIVTNAFLKLRL